LCSQHFLKETSLFQRKNTHTYITMNQNKNIRTLLVHNIPNNDSYNREYIASLFGPYIQNITVIKEIRYTDKSPMGTTFVKFDTPNSMFLAKSYMQSRKNCGIKSEIAKHDTADETVSQTRRPEVVEKKNYLLGKHAMTRNMTNFSVRPHMDFVFLLEHTIKTNNIMKNQLNHLVSEVYFDKVFPNDRLMVKLVGEKDTTFFPFSKKDDMKEWDEKMLTLSFEKSQSFSCNMIQSFMDTLEILRQDRSYYEDVRLRDLYIVMVVDSIKTRDEELIELFIEKIFRPRLPHFHLKIVSLKSYNKKTLLGKGIDSAVSKKISHFEFFYVGEQTSLKHCFTQCFKHLKKYELSEKTKSKHLDNPQSMFIDNQNRKIKIDFSDESIPQIQTSPLPSPPHIPPIDQKTPPLQDCPKEQVVETPEEQKDPFQYSLNLATRIIASKVLPIEEYFDLNTLFRRSTDRPMKTPMEGQLDTLKSKIARSLPVAMAKNRYIIEVDSLFNKYQKQIEQSEAQKLEENMHCLVMDTNVFIDVKPDFLRGYFVSCKNQQKRVFVPNAVISELEKLSNGSSSISRVSKEAHTFLGECAEQDLITLEESFNYNDMIHQYGLSNTNDNVIILSAFRLSTTTKGKFIVISTDRALLSKTGYFKLQGCNFYEYIASTNQNK